LSTKVSIMQCAYTILSSLGCVALKYFSTLSLKWHDFLGEKKLLSLNCVFLSLSKTFVCKISHFMENEPAMIKNVYWPS
jgi:hypothetical protein